MSDLYWLTEDQVDGLCPSFPKSHGKPRVDDRRVLSGIVFVNRNGLRWRDAPREQPVHWSVCWMTCARKVRNRGASGDPYCKRRMSSLASLPSTWLRHVDIEPLEHFDHTKWLSRP